MQIKCALKRDNVFAEYVQISTYGFKITINKKSSVVPIDQEGMHKLTEFSIDDPSVFSLKALMRKTASRCLLLAWSERKFNLTRMSSYLKLHTPLKNLA
jgi:hypothetical protein